MEISRKANKLSNRKSVVFYTLLMVIPIMQFLLFYVYVNINSFLLAFRDYITPEEYVFTFIGNFKYWFTQTEFPLFRYVGVSVLAYAVQLVVAIPLGLLFSYYIFKKFPFSNVFRVMLFLPTILSAFAVIKMYQYFVEALGVNWFTTLDATPRFVGVIIGNILVSFGTTVLIYTNKMASVGPEVFEAAQIDGASGFVEFKNIAFPIIFSSFSVFFIQGVSIIFTNHLNNFVLFGFESTSTETIGSFMFKRLEKSNSDEFLLPTLSALGLMISAITIPVTFLVRYLFNKYGPSED